MKKMHSFFCCFWLLAASLLPGQDNAKGSLVIIGGGLESALDRVYRRFIELGGGAEHIRLAIIPAGSSAPAVSGRVNAADFLRLGIPAERIRIFPLAMLDDPSSPDIDEGQWKGNGFNEELAKDMLDFTAVYFVGGDQIRYNQTLKTAAGGDSPLLRSIRQVYISGGVIGGSSAGAAMMCDPMICDGTSMNALLAGASFQPGSCPEARGLSLSTGLGFFSAGLVDQHFLKRGRIGRLLVALQSIPKFWLGLGIDEDTAAVFRAGTIEVLGSSGILVVDASEAKAGGTLAWSSDRGLQAKGILLHYLEEGDRFDMARRAPLPRPERKPVEKGKEANLSFPLETNAFAPDVLRRMMIDGMAENRKNETSAMAFELDAHGRGAGSRWTLRKTERFAGLYAGIDDEDTYSVCYVSLEIEPVSVLVRPLP